MNTKRILFWLGFLVVLGLIIWGLVVAANKPSAKSTLGAPAPVTAADHTIGAANPKVTLIEYGDFECPACAQFATVVEKLIDTSSTTLQVVFRHFPLPQHLNAPIAAQASEAAAAQGKFWDMYRLIYAGQNDWANLSEADAQKTFAGYALQLGLNVPKFNADIGSTTAKSFIQSELEEGQALGVNYTPSFFVDGKLVENPQSYEAFKAIIDAAAR